MFVVAMPSKNRVMGLEKSPISATALVEWDCSTAGDAFDQAVAGGAALDSDPVQRATSTR